ncbi:MAG TPA: serine/threonine-protein kinase [Coleofasciculaceae cyanobacterium]
MHQSIPNTQTVHCINPDCPRPYPQPWGNKFCNGCGATLCLNNRYIPLQRLGLGGFATIYSVWDLQLKTERVLKVLLETLPKALQLFEQEAAVLQRLKHPGVPRVDKNSYFVVMLDNPKVRSLPCLVMEKIHGKTLQDILNDHPQGCPEPLVRDWLNQAIEILGELHRGGIIHRDIKPSNLMLREETGQLVAIDFGGAKQIGSMPVGLIGTSTRLISPGYSPPEQIAGERIGLSADFYALGRTMIQLLTGQDLEDLQDPISGEFEWRSRVVVSPALANLLDDMTRIDPQQRPATAAEIQLRLAAIAKKPKVQNTQRLPNQIPASLTTTMLEDVSYVIATVGRGVAQLVGFVFQLITSIVFACLDTTWEMTLGGIGAAVGAAMGFGLINYTTVGDQFSDLLSAYLPSILPNLKIESWREILLFAVAGLVTTWGLTLAGGFGQQRRPIVAGIMGILGYSVGWLMWQVLFTYAPLGQLIAWSLGVGVAFLTLGLGLPSHYMVHALVAAFGTGTIFSGLVWLKVLPSEVLIDIFSRSDASLSDFINTIAFFCLWGITVGFWLGISYYILVPVLRWLGWR